MEEQGSIHHLIRRMTCWLPHIEIPTGIYGRRVIFDDLNILLGRLFFDREEPRWLSSDGYDLMPAMQLNVSSRLQRKIFYYPRAWGRKWLEAPLAQCMRGLLRSGDSLMKIDVEGAEARTVEGMLGTLVQAGYPALWIEVRGPKGSKRAPDTFQAVCQHLLPLGYRPHRWVKGQPRPADLRTVIGREDILFLPTQLEA